jgi:hypothetical protein
MKSRTLSAIAIILLTPLVVLAFQAQADQIRKGELNSKPFSVGLLKITLANFYLGNLAKTNDGSIDGTIVVAAESKRIGPKAKISNRYELTDKVRLPARLYYEDKLLATIIE